MVYRFNIVFDWECRNLKQHENNETAKQEEAHVIFHTDVDHVFYVRNQLVEAGADFSVRGHALDHSNPPHSLLTAAYDSDGDWVLNCFPTPQ